MIMRIHSAYHLILFTRWLRIQCLSSIRCRRQLGRIIALHLNHSFIDLLAADQLLFLKFLEVKFKANGVPLIFSSWIWASKMLDLCFPLVPILMLLWLHVPPEIGRRISAFRTRLGPVETEVFLLWTHPAESHHSFRLARYPHHFSFHIGA